MPRVPYPYEVNGKLVTGNGSLIPICSLSNRSLLPSLTVLGVLITELPMLVQQKSKQTALNNKPEPMSLPINDLP